MIEKVDSKFILGPKPFSSTRLTPSGKSLEFQSVLKDKLDPSKPLEIVLIQLLSRAIDALVSAHSDDERENPFSLPSTPYNLPFNPPRVGNPSLPPVSSPLEDVSNNLQEQKGFDPIIEEASRTYGVDSSLIRAMIQVESSGNPFAVSPAGAQGLMQLMPSTAADLGVKDAFDPDQNIMAGTRYLRQLLDRYQGDLRLALAAYNWGMGNLERLPGAMPGETQRYIAKIENLYHSQRVAHPKTSLEPSPVS